MRMQISIPHILVISILIVLTHSQCAGPDVVGPLPNLIGLQICSYAGFAPLDSNNDSALFYWYVPNQQNDPNAPIIVWLQGELGQSATWGLLSEKIGPYQVVSNPNGGYNLNYTDGGYEKSWSYYYNILFIDNPTGVGYSYFTTNVTNATTSVEQNADDIWKALQFFIKLHNVEETLSWFYAGESLGAKTVLALANRTLGYNAEIKNNTLVGNEINLKGIIIGNGVFNGFTQILNLINPAIGASFIAPYQIEQIATLAIHCEENAFKTKKKRLGISSCVEVVDYMRNVSGIDPTAISLTTNQTLQLSYNNKAYLNEKDVYTALNVNGSKRNKGDGTNLFIEFDIQASQAIENELLNSSLSYINSLLHQLPCLIFDGAFDIKDGPAGTQAWLSELESPYNAILNQTKNIWFNSSSLNAGFWRQLYNLTYITFSFAGEYVPFFQLNDTLLMLSNFINGDPWEAPNSFQNVSNIMSGLLNNCSGHGQPAPNGLCVCDAGFQLADCSVQPTPFSSSVNVTLGPRGMAFFVIDLEQSDQILQIIGNAMSVLAFYSYSGTVSDPNAGVAVLFPTLQSIGVRSFYISQEPGNTVYLTLQNTNYDQNLELLVLVSKVLIVESFFASTTSAVIIILLTLGSAFSLYTAIAFIIRQRRAKEDQPLTTEFASSQQSNSNYVSQMNA